MMLNIEKKEFCDGGMALCDDCFHIYCLPLLFSLKRPGEGAQQTRAASTMSSSALPGQAEQFVPGGSVRDGSTFYQVQSILGEGTFGKVAKCTRMNDKKIVAIKMIKKRGSCTDAQKEVARHFSL